MKARTAGTVGVGRNGAGRIGSALVAALTLLAFGLGAQDLIPRIRLESRNLMPMELQSLRVEAFIDGFLAETRVTLTFRNPNPLAIEGELVFPLPEGAFVSGYALDIQGRMVDGVAVDKEKARAAFETEVRRGVDPGLAEMVRGNNFRTRIYPLPAAGARQVMVRYVSPVVEGGPGMRYVFPFRHPQPIPQVSFRIETRKDGPKPVVRESALDGLDFTAWRESYVAERSVRNLPLARTLVIDLPPVRARAAVVEVGPDGRHYFAIRDTLDLPAPVPASPPERVAVIWDASASRQDDDHAREREFLRRLVGQWGRGPVTVVFQVLRHRLISERVLTVRGGDAAPLLAEIDHLYYDGGTQLGAIRPPSPAPDYVLLFSDGQGNFGAALPPDGPVPLIAVSAAPDADRLVLRHLAGRSGGRAIDLLTEDPATAARVVGRPVFSFLRAEYLPRQIREWTPGTPCPAGGSAIFGGILTGEDATVTLVYGVPGKGEVRRTVNLSRSGALRGSLLRTWWASRTVDELLVLGSRNEEKIRRFGRDYGLVTPFTSLLVLESLEQYLRHGVVPPESLPDLRREYLARQSARARSQGEEKRARLERVLAEWRERVAWWEKDFLTGFRQQKPRELPPENLTARQEMAAPPGGVAEESMVVADGDRTRGAMAAAPGAPVAMEKKVAGGRPAGRPAAITLREWSPDTPYLRELKATEPQRQREVYLHYRAEYGRSPAFFLDVADFFARRDPDLAVQILSNLAELELENHTLLRILGRRLQQIGKLEWAQAVFTEVLRLRPEEPQSLRDLALLLAERGHTEEALRHLYSIVTRPWERFDGIELVALMELNRIVARTGFRDFSRLGIDRRFIRNLDLDLRVVLNWDADATDIDLWVQEPSGEICNYRRPLSSIGGRFTNDFTQGYGPEEYVLKRGLPGRYEIKTDFYGSSAQKMLGAVTLQLEIITDFGRPSEKRRVVTVRLSERKEKLVIGEVTL